MIKDKIHISPIKEMEIRSACVPGVLSLAQGIPSFDTPECIKKKAIEAIEEGNVARYSLSPGLLELREAIEISLAKNNIFYDFEKEIIVTAGSIEAITATFLTLLEPGDEVLIPDPTYTSYQAAIKTAGGVPVFVPLDEARGWAFDIEQFKRKITPKTKAVLYCNPNNPTGTIYSRSQLMELAELAQMHDLYVLSDEVYRDFLFDQDEEFFSLGQFSSFRKKFIYIFSFSKSYAMTGWRVAYLATDKSLAQKILGVHDALVTCAPVISQWAALAALEMANQEVDDHRQELKSRRDLVCKKLDRLSKWIEYQKPSSAYFVLPKIKTEFKERFLQYHEKNPIKIANKKSYHENSFSWQFCLRLLCDAKVAFVPGIAFGPSGEDHFRLCFGRRKENMIKAIDRMEEFFKKIDK